jgi:hypothetical protein
VLDLAYQIEDAGELRQLMAVEVDHVLAAVWPRLQAVKSQYRAIAVNTASAIQP